MAKPTTHAIGLAFENHALRFLNNDMRMALSHVGRAADGGVDLRGYWWLPKAASKKTTSDETAAKRAPKSVQPPGLAKDGTPGRRIAPLRIIGQCKAESKPQGARVVREMEGVLGHLTNESSTLAPLGVIFSQSGFSKLAMAHATACSHPLLLMYLEGGRPGDEEEVTSPDGLPSTVVSGAWWNAAFGAILASRGIEIRRELGRNGAHLGLWYAGSRMGRYGPA